MFGGGKKNVETVALECGHEIKYRPFWTSLPQAKWDHQQTCSKYAAILQKNSENDQQAKQREEKKTSIESDLQKAASPEDETVSKTLLHLGLFGKETKQGDYTDRCIRVEVVNQQKFPGYLKHACVLFIISFYVGLFAGLLWLIAQLSQ